jgi:hypothetical protein
MNPDLACGTCGQRISEMQDACAACGQSADEVRAEVEPRVGESLDVAAESAGAGISATGDTVKPAQPSAYVGTLTEHLCPG